MTTRHASPPPLTDIACTLCHSADTVPVCTKFGLAIARCTGCGLPRATPRCAPERINARYSAEYFWGEYLPSLGVVDGHLDEAFIDQRYGPWVEMLSAAVGSGRQLLEIGSGAGLFAKAFARAGWRVTGVEVNEAGATFARERLGLDVRQQYAEDLDLPAGSVDAVAMMDVIEHVPDPQATLRTALRFLRPGGVLLLQTPNINALSYSALGVDWAVLSPAEHLYYFSEDTLRRLLTQVGFSGVEFVWAFAGFGPAETMNARYTHAPDAWRSRAYAAAVRMGGGALLQWAQRHHRTDQLIVLARAAA